MPRNKNRKPKAQVSPRKQLRKHEEALKGMYTVQQQIHGMSMVMVGAVMMLNKKHFGIVDGRLVTCFENEEGVLMDADENIVTNATKVISDSELEEIIAKVAQEHGTIQPAKTKQEAVGSEVQSIEESGGSGDTAGGTEEPGLSGESDAGTLDGDPNVSGHAEDAVSDEPVSLAPSAD